jgi:hypothetical protein
MSLEYSHDMTNTQNSETMPRNDGDFLSQEFDWTPVDEEYTNRKRPLTRTIGDITLHRQMVTMWSGTRHEVVSTTLPDDRRTTDVASIETSAFTTKFGGLNLRRQLALSRLGIESTFVGVQQNRNKFGHLEESAHDQLEVAQFTAEQFGRDQEYILLNGISRGAMIDLGAASIAAEHNQTVLYGDYIVPCFPFGLDLDTVRNIGSILKNEKDPVKSLLSIPWRTLRHYPGTVDKHPLKILQQLKEVPTLLSGTVGTMILDNKEQVAPNMFGHVTVYRGDVLSHAEQWQRHFSSDKYPHMVVDMQEGGGHMSCATDVCYNAWLGRMTTISQILQQSGGLLALTGKEAPVHLHHLAGERNFTFKSHDTLPDVA